MSPKKTLVLLVVAIAIILFYVQDKEKVEEAKKVEVANEGFVTAESDDIMALKIERPGKPTIAAEREGEEWRMTEPVEWAGDKFAWKTVADNLTSAKTTYTYPEEGETLSDGVLKSWGLEPEHLKLTAVLREASEEVSFKFGGNPPGSTDSRYATNGRREGKVFVIPQSTVFSSSKEVLSFRNRVMLDVKVDRDDLSEIAVSNKDLDFVAKRDDRGKWVLSDHGGIQVDVAHLRTFTTSLSAQAEDILDDLSEEELREAGLADDQLESATSFRVVQSSDGSSKTFYVGGFSQKYQNHLGRRDGTGSMFVLNDSPFFKDFETDLNTIRPKKATNLDTYNAEIVVATAEGNTLYSLSKEEFQWRMNSPHDATGERDNCDGLVRSFNDHKIASYLENATPDADLGLDPPALVFTVTGEDKSSTVLFGKRDGLGNVYAAWEGYPDRFLLPQELYETLSGDPLDLLTPAERDRIAPPAPAPSEASEEGEAPAPLDLEDDEEAPSEDAGSAPSDATTEEAVSEEAGSEPAAATKEE